MSSKTVTCDVCEISCARLELMDHLASKTHLRRSRKGVGDWTEEQKKKSLILLSNFPLVDGRTSGGDGGTVVQDKSGVVALLQQCATLGGVVTHFVAWEETPFVGLVQFQKKKMAKQLIRSVRDGDGNPEKAGKIWMDVDHIVDPGRMSNYTEDELLEMLPVNNNKDIAAEPTWHPIEVGPVNSSLILLEEDEDQSGNAVGNREPPLLLELDDDEEAADPCVVVLDATMVELDAVQKTLASQYKLVEQIMTYAESDFQRILEVVQAIKAEFIASGPVEVAMFRNGFLKLKNPYMNEDDLFIFLASGSHWSKLRKGPFTWLPGNRNENHLGWKMRHNLNGAEFWLVTHPSYIPSVQLCRMTEYLLTFDARAKPLMTLVYYWMSVNAASVGQNPSLEPLTLQWLVIFFLTFRGIVPSPRQVQAVPHLVLPYAPYGGPDIGFVACPDFRQEWVTSRKQSDPSSDQNDDQMAFQVLQLFQNFLEFYETATKERNLWILNTQDGELLDFATVADFGGAKNKKWTSKMKPEETAAVRGHHCIQTTLVSGEEERQCKLHVIHPFNFGIALCLPEEFVGMSSLMHKSGGQLWQFLEVATNLGVNAATEQFGELTELLKSRV